MNLFNSKKLQTYCLATLAALLLSACASTPQQDSTAAADTETLDEKYQAMESQAQDQREQAEAQALNDQQQALLDQTRLHFEFDEAGISQQYQAVLKAHAKYLQAHPQQKLVLEGHADERGTREYNMALGERRADNVEQALVLMGVSAQQLRPTSLGEEAPLVSGRSEQSYYENRRVELKYDKTPQLSQADTSSSAQASNASW